MKLDPPRWYGYPVLQTLTSGAAIDTSNYLSGEFQADIKARLSKKNESDLCFEYELTTSVLGLREVVEDKLAAYFLRVQCRDTYFSLVQEVSQSGKLYIPKNKIRGIIKVDAFIITVRAAAIFSDQINPAVAFDHFSVRAGMVLAHQAPTTHYVEKYSPPVFEYRQDENIEKGEFAITLEEGLGTPAYVRAHPEQIELFKKAIGDGRGRAIFLNSIIFVAVMEMFRVLINDYDSHKDTRWAKFLKTSYDGEINAEMDIVKATQAVLKQPLQSLNERFYSQLQLQGKIEEGEHAKG